MKNGDCPSGFPLEVVVAVADRLVEEGQAQRRRPRQTSSSSTAHHCPSQKIRRPLSFAYDLCPCRPFRGRVHGDHDYCDGSGPSPCHGDGLDPCLHGVGPWNVLYPGSSSRCTCLYCDCVFDGLPHRGHDGGLSCRGSSIEWIFEYRRNGYEF